MPAKKKVSYAAGRGAGPTPGERGKSVGKSRVRAEKRAEKLARGLMALQLCGRTIPGTTGTQYVSDPPPPYGISSGAFREVCKHYATESPFFFCAVMAECLPKLCPDGRAKLLETAGKFRVAASSARRKGRPSARQNKEWMSDVLAARRLHEDGLTWKEVLLVLGRAGTAEEVRNLARQVNRMLPAMALKDGLLAGYLKV